MRRQQISDPVRLSIADATELGIGALEHAGFPADQARIICDHLVDAAASGYTFAGLPRILEIADDPRMRQPRKPIRVARETPVSILIDGGNNIGYYAVHEATRMAIAKAKQSHIALVGLYDSALSGRNAYYLEMIARENLAGIMYASAWPVVAPEGGARPMLGTNPIGIALPTGGVPMIYDIGTSAVMRGDLALHARLDEPLPEGVAIDSEGLPTRDPHRAIKGSILPFGGPDRHKGYGLSLTIQALGLMAGASLPHGRVQDYSQTFIVFEPGLLVPEADFKRDVAELLKRIKATPRRPGVDEIRIPFERAYRERERARKEGIVVDRKIYEALQKMRG